MMGVPGPNLTAVMYDYAKFWAGAGCAQQTATIASTVEIPGTLTVGTTDITADDQSVAVDVSKLVNVSWKPASPGSADLYVVKIGELTNDGFATSLTDVRAFFTVTPSLRIPPAVLESGHTYILDILAYVGRPGAKTGDLTRFAFPSELV